MGGKWCANTKSAKGWLVKTCSRCREFKIQTDFYPDDRRTTGLSSRCKKCQKQQAQEWGRSHPESRRQIIQNWKSRTDIPKHNRKIWNKRVYNLTPEDTERLSKSQKGVCAVCGEGLTSKYHIDHDHITGKIRGLLCRSCNLGLGFFQDSVPKLMAAIQYLGVKP